MPMKHFLQIGLSFFLFCPIVQAQQQPKIEDVSTLDGIIHAYYEVVSAPAGQARDWARDSSLHLPGAQVLIVSNDSLGNAVPQKMSLAAFHERSGQVSETGFFEYEIARETQRHGAVAHVWSSYEWRNAKDGPIGGKGNKQYPTHLRRESLVDHFLDV